VNTQQSHVQIWLPHSLLRWQLQPFFLPRQGMLMMSHSDWSHQSHSWKGIIEGLKIVTSERDQNPFFEQFRDLGGGGSIEILNKTTEKTNLCTVLSVACWKEKWPFICILQCTPSLGNIRINGLGPITSEKYQNQYWSEHFTGTVEYKLFDHVSVKMN
jgi:hypothetical protein